MIKSRIIEYRAIISISITILIAVILSLFVNHIRTAIFLWDYPSRTGEYLTLWAQSDLHLDSELIDNYRTVIDDINTFPGTADISIVAGDIADYRNAAPYYSLYHTMKMRSGIKYWYEIAGNHDNYDNASYKKYVGKPDHYSVRVGNIVILLISDQDVRDETVISDATYRWWVRKVKENQDKIIITVTHGTLEESGLTHEVVKNIQRQERFSRILKKYTVDVWIFGHTHFPHRYIKQRLRRVNDLGGTTFINVAAIDRNYRTDAESCIIIFKKNSRKFLIRSRNHTEGIFDRHLDRLCGLNRKFKWNSGPPVSEFQR